MNFHPGWLLIALGLVTLVVGLVWVFAPGVPLGRLPGDIRIETEHTKIYIPIVTCLVLSAVLTGIMWIVQRLAR
jgi:hypothetical protein